jgi:hypothetical protein
MSSVYSQSLYFSSWDTTLGFQDLFTTAVGFQTVLRDISGWVDADPGGEIIYIVNPGSAPFPFISIPSTPGLGFSWTGRVVIGPGMDIQLADALDGAHGAIQVSGYQLTLP